MHQPRQAMLVLAACLASCGGYSSSGHTKGDAPVSLRGAVSTFSDPFFYRAIPAYELSNNDVLVTYDAVGSDESARRFIGGTVDFAVSEVPIRPAGFAVLKGGANGVLEFPIDLSGVALVYNIPDSPHLRLTRAAIADIYSGAISRWDDKAIAAANPGVILPRLRIIPVHRSDASGSTFILTDYLSSESTQWTLGRASQIMWPGPPAVGETGSVAVGARVKRTAGAIGYVPLANALTSRLPAAAVENSSGQFSTPTVATVRAAAAGLQYPTPENFSLVGAKGGAYPIAGYSWGTISMAEPDSDRQHALCGLFLWLLTDGQRIAKTLGYAELSVDATAKPVNDLSRCASSAKSP
jgi:phosphate transport system substrate-binding protein